MTSIAVQRRPARGTLLTLALGHSAADLSSGALWALLPFLVAERHYSYAAVGVFALTASVAGAAFQPLAGVLGDRYEARLLLPTGLVIAGLGIGVVGFTTAFVATLLAVIVCSAGIATYHPESARWARHSAGSRVTANMGVYSVGGGLGWALGPLIVAIVLAPLGLHGTAFIAVIPFAAAVAVTVVISRFRDGTPHEHRATGRSFDSSSCEWRPFVVLLVLYSLSSGVTSGLLTFVPLFLLSERGASPSAGNVMSSVLLAAGAGGTLLGGVAAHRFGRRWVLIAPQLVLVPAIAVLPSLGYASMVPLVIVIGVAMNMNMSITLVLSQEYLPPRMGLATGLLIGVCSGAGGLIIAALGVLGDAVGLAPVLYVLAALPLAVAALSATLSQPAAVPPGTVWRIRRPQAGANEGAAAISSDRRTD